MNKELIIRSNSDNVDFALLKDGKLIEFQNDEDNSKFSVGDVFLAKVRKSVPGLNAAFVNVGYHKDAFLHYHDLGPKLPTLMKFMKRVSTGKLKDYSLKNFTFEEDIKKDGSIDSIIKSNSLYWFKLQKNQSQQRDHESVPKFHLQDVIWYLFRFLIEFQFLKKLKVEKKKNALNAS